MEKKCPKCRTKSKGYAKVKKIFGFRIMNNCKFVQSWCRKCRK